MRWLLSVFGVCRHDRLTWPQTHGGRCTTVCLDCTRRLHYDFERMQLGAEVRFDHPSPVSVGSSALPASAWNRAGWSKGRNI